MKADKVIFGNIYTVDRKQPKAGAAAIDGGKFIYVGDEATTLNEAYQLLCDDRLGSITVGRKPIWWCWQRISPPAIPSKLPIPRYYVPWSAANGSILIS